MRSARILCAVLLGCMALHSSAFAQGTADLVGRVTDPSGAVLPGVTVTAENEGTRVTRVATTNETGDYVFTLLPIGSYSVTIELQGFATQNSKLTLGTGDRVRVDAKLQVGAVAETVLVTGTSPLVQTDSSTVRTLFTEKLVQDSPLQERNIIRLVQLSPGANEGAVSSTANGTRPDDRRQSSSVSINAVNDIQNNQQIDGTDNNERAIGTVVVKPSIDAIAEVKVETNLYSAENGRTAGGVINIITKSGANAYHGSGFEFLRTDKLNEKDYFAITKPKLSQNNFGGSFGGPIVKGKTFFFVDYEGYRLTQGVANLLTVPTAKMRAGNFSELSTQIYDPLTTPRAAFAGNVIPVNRLDPIALRLIALYPLPNQPGLSNNFSSVTDRTQNLHTTDIRIDHHFDSNNSLFARYSYNKVDTFTPGACPIVNDVDPNCIVGGIAAGGAFPGPNNSYAHNVVGSFVHIFSPTLLGEVKGSFGHPYLSSLPANYGKNLGTQFGIPNTNFDASTSGMPLMSTTGYALLGDAQAVPLTTQDKTKQFAVSVSKTTGAHSFKIGGGVVFRAFSVLQSISPVGVFTFDTLATNGPGGVGGNTIASLLLGYPSTVVRAHNPFQPWYHTNEPNLYVQDNWHATSWLTLNLGIRYDVFTPFTEEAGTLSNFDPVTKKMIVAGQGGASDTAGVNTDWKDIGPRLGFAASVTPTMVVRGGYAISYFPGNTLSGSYLKNPPFTANYGPVTNTAASGLVPNVRLSDGLPPLANNSDLTNLSGSIIAVASDFRSNRVQQFSFAVDKEFGKNALSASYIGARGDNLAVQPNYNLAPAGPGAVQPRRPYASLYPNLSGVSIFDNVSESTYNAMQLVFQRRYNAGLTFSTHYTLAHGQTLAPTAWDANQLEWADSALDIRHRWVVNTSYELPFGNGLTGIAAGFAKGWQVNVSAYYQTGLPFTVTNAAARMNTGGADRPNMIGNPELPSDQQTIQRWFDTTAFVAQPQFTAGSTPGTVMHGPPNRRLDLSFFKDLPLSGNAKVQLRAEIYNLTNVANFVNPNSALGNPAFGTISSTGNAIPRQMQLGIKFLF